MLSAHSLLVVTEKSVNFDLKQTVLPLQIFVVKHVGMNENIFK